MIWLPDSNIFLRNVDTQSPLHAIAVAALDAISLRVEPIVLIPQVLYEFWSVATRPASARGGLGWSTAQAEEEIRRLIDAFPLYPDTSTIFPRWLSLAATFGVSGINVHDTRLVAAMHEHSITHLLTFDGDHFARYPDITVVAPETLRFSPE
jgi:predicted nucleic acid-binding protein